MISYWLISKPNDVILSLPQPLWNSSLQVQLLSNWLKNDEENPHKIKPRNPDQSRNLIKSRKGIGKITPCIQFKEDPESKIRSTVEDLPAEYQINWIKSDSEGKLIPGKKELRPFWESKQTHMSLKL